MAEERLKYTEIAPEGIGAMRAVEHYLNASSGLGASLLGLVRLRASLINGCEFCLAMHGHELKSHNEPEGRIKSIADWRASDAYTRRERAALAWTEAVTLIGADHAPDEVFGLLREHFDEKEVVDLTIAIASINAWNRLAISFRSQWKEPGPVVNKAEAPVGATAKGGQDTGGSGNALEDDGGKVSVD